MQAERRDAIVIGGGFYGCTLAVHLRRVRGADVLLVEAGDELLTRASYANQARVHNGYHYPRSFLTGLRSRVNFERFVREHARCIVDEFDKYYAIGRSFSKVTAAQFEIFCARIGAPLEPAPPAVERLFRPERIERVFRAREVAFDAARLRATVADELEACGVPTRLRTRALSATREGDGLRVHIEGPDGPAELRVERAFNCTYSGLNGLLCGSGLEPIPLKHEWTELALVEVPPELEGLGVTVMCGPYFSLMPFPPRGLHTLSHVRYTPHAEWRQERGPERASPDPDALPRRSHFEHMVRDAARYLPAVAGCRHVDSLWEVKTVLPRSEVDDSRPILYKEADGLPGLTSIMGSKIDNVYDMLEYVDARLGPLASCR